MTASVEAVERRAQSRVLDEFVALPQIGSVKSNIDRAAAVVERSTQSDRRQRRHRKFQEFDKRTLYGEGNVDDNIIAVELRLGGRSAEQNGIDAGENSSD